MTPMPFKQQYQRGNADRFIGQRFTMKQEHKLLTYYNQEPEYSRPPWAQAWYWYTQGHELLWKPDLSWDFGLSCEQEAMRKFNLGDDVDEGFFARIERRRLAMEEIYKDRFN